MLRALRTTGIVNAREDVVEGLDQGFLGRSDVVPLERKRTAAFRRVRVFWKRRIFRRYRHLWSRKSGRRDGRFWMEKSHWTRMSRATETPANTARTRKCADLTKRSTGFVMRELENLKEDEAMELIRKEVADGNEVHGGSAAGH